MSIETGLAIWGQKREGGGRTPGGVGRVRKNQVPGRKDAARHDRRPNELALEARDRGRAGIAAGCDRSLLLLAAHTPRKHREQHDPPDDEIDRDRGCPRHQACSSSIRVPQKSFGCRNSTGLPWEPTFAWPSPSTRAP